MNGTQARLNFIYLISKLVIEARIQDIRIMPFAFFRSTDEQHKLFLEGKSKCDGYKKQSKHQQWQAMDFVVIKDGVPVWARTADYESLGRIWTELGGIWGGDFKSLNDPYHFEI